MNQTPNHQCRACGHGVAWDCETCPKCGASRPATSQAANVVAFILCLFVFLALVVWATKDNMPS